MDFYRFGRLGDVVIEFVIQMQLTVLSPLVSVEECSWGGSCRFVYDLEFSEFLVEVWILEGC